MKKNIAIVAGGYSSEYVVSVKSAEQIEASVDTTLYNAYKIVLTKNDWFYEQNGEKINVDKNDFSITIGDKKIIFDCAFIIIHGTPGEDGKLQAYFDLVGLPYTTCDVLTSSLTFNKFFCKSYLRNYGVVTPSAMLLRKNDKIDASWIVENVGLPCFIKPNNGGSSFGITKVKKKEQIRKAIQEALKEDDEVIIEGFIQGTEVTCGIFKSNEDSYVFPLTEIVSKNEFFDYEAKYTDGVAEEITPARITENQTKKCQDISSEIYDFLNCNGIVRMDYILKDGDFYFIEVNTVPGMSANSIVPKQLKENDMTMTELISLLISDAISRNK